VTRRTALLALTAWVWGMATTIERLQARFRRIDVRSDRGDSLTAAQSELLATVGADWARYAGQVVVLGALSGLLVWFAGGWWYRKRLTFCGAEPSPSEARRVYLVTGLVWAVPVVVAAALGTGAGPSPWAAYGPGLAAVGAGAHLASFVVSTAVVVRAFPVRRAPALAWFLLLPAALVVALVSAGLAEG